MTTSTTSTTSLLPRAATVTSPDDHGVSAGRSRRDAAVRLGAGAALWAAVLLVTFWWVRDGGVQDLGGWASGLTSVGRLSGLVASLLLLVQVLLMARVPLLEGPFGQDRLARIHRVVGFTSFDLLLVHLVTVVWGYAAGEVGRVPATVWDLVVDYPGVLLAVAGTLALVMVVVTSIRAARRRLRYESWHLLHLYAYLGAGLALPHQLWTGSELLTSTAATVFWWTAWGAALAAVLVWRVALPLWRSARHGLRVTAVHEDGPEVVSVLMAGRALHRLPAQAGQFLTVRFLDGPGLTRGHPYSLSAAPDGCTLRVSARTHGDGGARLRHLRPGTRVLLEGPYGRLSARARTSPKVLLVGAGIGITPLRALAEGLTYAPGEATLLYRYSGHPVFAAELDALSDARGLRVVALPGRRRAQGSWLGVGTPSFDDVEAIRFLVPDVAERDVYVCGPAPWAGDVRRAALAAGTPDERIHLEDFGW